MIRQAISCDICGTEMLTVNHWFVACDQGSELRVSSWNSRSRLRAGTKHLCGQTCLHKLVDEFMARALSTRVSPSTDKLAIDKRTLQAKTSRANTSLTSTPSYSDPPRPTVAAAYIDEKEKCESPALLIAPPEPSSRAWRLEAWKRERERAQRAAEQRPARRRSIA